MDKVDHLHSFFYASQNKSFIKKDSTISINDAVNIINNNFSLVGNNDLAIA
jgi:hypothetical protein